MSTIELVLEKIESLHQQLLIPQYTKYPDNDITPIQPDKEYTCGHNSRQNTPDFEDLT